MNRSRACALALTLALHAYLLWVLLGPDATHRVTGPQAAHPVERQRPQTRVAERRTAPGHEEAHPLRGTPSPRTASTIDPGVADAARRSAYAAGRDFQVARVAEWIRQQHRRIYGDAIAAAMDLPFPEAWRKLESMALAGDRAAGEALIELAPQCTVEQHAGWDARMLEGLTRDTAPADAAFITGAYEAEVEARLRTQTECLGTGLGMPRLRALVEARTGALPAGAELGNEGLTEFGLVAMVFSELYGRDDLGSVGLSPIDSLGDRLYDHSGTVSQADLDALFAAIDSDPRALQILANCYILGCNGIAPLPPAERLSWSLRAARVGSPHALRDVIDQREHDRDLATAYQWATFQRWLAERACLPPPNAGAVSWAIQVQSRLARQMSAADLAMAGQRAQQLAASYGGSAMAIQDCVPAH